MSPLQLKRVILFARNLDALTVFYRDVLGFKIKAGSPEEGWVDFDAGGCALALHRGKSRRGSAKLAFWSADVKKTRDKLADRGAKFGKVKDFGDLVLCDGQDPEGNLFQLSNRP
jgi:catechol 2,3-dioxygenase-like lactoylglutathione lyase family enzyme